MYIEMARKTFPIRFTAETNRVLFRSPTMPLVSSSVDAISTRLKIGKSAFHLDLENSKNRRGPTQTVSRGAKLNNILQTYSY